MTEEEEEETFIEWVKEKPNDKKTILTAIVYPSILQFIDKDLFKDKEFMKELITTNGFALEYMPEEYKDDKEIVLIALRESAGFAFKYASQRLREDREVVYEAVKKYRQPLKYASKELQDEINEKMRKIKYY